MLWNIWKARNQAVFRGRKPEALAIIDAAQALLKSYHRWNPRKGGSRNDGEHEPEFKVGKMSRRQHNTMARQEPLAQHL